MINSAHHTDGSKEAAPSQSNKPMTQSMASAEAFNHLFLTRAETASLLRISPLTVFRLVERRVLPVYRICRKLLFKREDVVAFAERNRHGARSPDV